MNGNSLSMIIRYLYLIWISKFNEICYLLSIRGQRYDEVKSATVVRH